MVLTTQFSALAAIGTRHIDVGPGFVDEAGNGVTLDSQGRDPPRVDDICGGDQETYLFTDRKHQRFIHLQQVIGIFVTYVVNLLSGCTQITEEGYIFAKVFVLPLPLIASDFDIHISFIGIVNFHQCLGGRNSHQYQNKKRD